MKILNSATDLKKLAAERKHDYLHADPFPSIVFHDFFDEDFLSSVLNEFPDLSKKAEIQVFDNNNEKKLAAKGESYFGDNSKILAHFLNSQPIIEFLQELTGITETLVPDPFFVGGGFHEIKPGGLLKVHADFNKNPMTMLDRRINLLVYLNKDWQESYGGHFELWDRNMEKAHNKILPTFNTVAIFTTTDFSYHGHPDPLTCPPDRSRKSVALYYYSNGRPSSEVNSGLEEHTTLFKERKEDIAAKPGKLKVFLHDLTPPIVLKLIKGKK